MKVDLTEEERTFIRRWSREESEYIKEWLKTGKLDGTKTTRYHIKKLKILFAKLEPKNIKQKKETK
jgi:hypothetical protein